MNEVIMTKELELNKVSDLAVPSELYDDVQGGGFEGVKVEDIAIPYLRILQALSGEVKKGSKQVPGAEVGDIYLSALDRLYKDGVSVVPCSFSKRYIERVVGVTGSSGYVATHTDGAIMARTVRSADGKYDMLENGNHVVETAYHYVIIATGGENIRAVISFASTQRKKSRAWLATMGAVRWEKANGAKWTPPSFANAYLLTSGEESRDQNTWYGWQIGKPERITDRQLALDAKKLYLDVQGGAATAAPEHDEAAEPKTT
ncbi:MAG: hypothetical protein MN733_10125, partial [Nitrososphaera sp.]|nr:hypothetical protein [Nitrososphaera sp.]